MVEVCAGFTDCNVKVHSDMGGRREPGRADVRGGNADRVVPGIVGGEGESASGWTSGVH